MAGDRGAEDGVATIHAAVDAGVTLLDTGDFYGAGGRSELLAREALWSVRREKLLVAVSFGVQRGPDGAWLGMDLRPTSVKNYVTYSLRRLGTDHIDLYWPACPDPAVPIEDTVGALADLVTAGYVRYVGLANVSAQTIRKAHAVHPIAAVQLNYSLPSRGAEREVLPTLRELGIGFVAHDAGWLRRLYDAAAVRVAGDGHAHARSGRSPSARDSALASVLAEIAAEKDVTAVRVALAWVLARSHDVVPLIDPRQPGELADTLGAQTVRLSNDDLRRMENAVPSTTVGAKQLTPLHLAWLSREQPHAIG
jgi:aryl-alcohol dehydrogenase-like predicted oxidoreductase